MAAKSRVFSAAIVFTLMALASAGFAQSAGSGAMAGMKHRLSAACTGKSADAPCSFTRRDGETEDGTCVSVEAQTKSRLVCMSERMKNRMSKMGEGSAGMPAVPKNGL